MSWTIPTLPSYSTGGPSDGSRGFGDSQGGGQQGYGAPGYGAAGYGGGQGDAQGGGYGDQNKEKKPEDKKSDDKKKMMMGAAAGVAVGAVGGVMLASALSTSLSNPRLVVSVTFANLACQQMIQTRMFLTNSNTPNNNTEVTLLKAHCRMRTVMARVLAAVIRRMWRRRERSTRKLMRTLMVVINPCSFRGEMGKRKGKEKSFVLSCLHSLNF